MIRADFNRSLKRLESELIILGKLVEGAVEKSVNSLKDRDLETSKVVIAEDDIIDLKRFELEDQCVHLVATQQPLATDLRTIITVLHVSVEL